MNAWIEWNGNSLPSSFKIKPGEPITLAAYNFAWDVEHVRFQVWSSSGIVLNQSTARVPLVDVPSRLPWVTPSELGTYSFQAFGGIGEHDKSNIVTMIIDPMATEPAPAQTSGQTLLTALKWTAVIAAGGFIGYFLVKSGLFAAGTSAVKRKLEKTGSA